ncbi:MAG: glycosyltransferase family A protein [Cyclobacteriaceae bacterium]
MRVDLVYLPFSNSVYPDWKLGEIRMLPPHIPNAMVAIDSLIKNSTAGFTLIWNYKYGIPDQQLVMSLVEKPIDVWHAGLRLGLQGKPLFLQNIYPTWMYNYDTDPEIESTSFRLSMDACLFRNETWMKAGSGDGGFMTLQMVGLDLGYRWIKSGAVIRYNPELITVPVEVKHDFNINEEFRFVRKNFPAKWFWWVLIRNISRYGLRALGSAWKTRHIVQQHHLLKGFTPAPSIAEMTEGSVSLLIPTLDRYEYLINELEQLKNQTLRPFEILITDQTKKEFRDSHFLKNYSDLNIRYFPQDEQGQCYAWNKLLSEAKGEFVLFLGDDADGITPDFIARLVSDCRYYNADMVASHVVEVGIEKSDDNDNNIRLADGFPICLVKRSLLLKTGFMDKVFNRDIRADHDLAMRCHKLGALMIYDKGCTILHHRAPSGGLRTHKARVHTWSKSKSDLFLILLPTFSEFYLMRKYYNEAQVKEELATRMFSLFFIHGAWAKRVFRLLVVIIKYPYIKYQMHKRNKWSKRKLKSINSL